MENEKDTEKKDKERERERERGGGGGGLSGRFQQGVNASGFLITCDYFALKDVA